MCTVPLALAPQRTRHWSRYAAGSRHLENVEGTPAARRALLSMRPHVIWGLPTGRGFATQLVNSLRGTLDMGMRGTCPAHRRKRHGGSSAGPRREGQCTPLQSTPATSGPRSSMAHRPPTPPTRRRRQRAHGANSHAPRLQPPSSTPLRSGGLPLWATAPSPEPRPRGRTKPRPATPAPKPRLTSPSAFQQNIGTRKLTRERNISCT